MPFIAQQTILERWTIIDVNGNPLTGMTSPADVLFYLYRQSGSSLIAASETVTLTEIGATGTYYISLTPQEEGYYSNALHEINVATQKRWQNWTYEILPAGAVFTPTFDNAFCSQSDVERWSQMAFSATSKPTVLQAAAFAESRASEIMSFLAAAGYAVLPADPGLPGTVQEDMLRETNAIGAAGDAIAVKFMGDSPSRSDKAEALLKEYDKRVERLVDYARAALASSPLRTHVSSGAVTLSDETPIEDPGVDSDKSFSMEDEF